MRIRSPKDFWSGLFFITVAAAFIGLSLQYGTGTMHRMGPGLFPILVGALLVGLVGPAAIAVLEATAVPTHPAVAMTTSMSPHAPPRLVSQHHGAAHEGDRPADVATRDP